MLHPEHATRQLPQPVIPPPSRSVPGVLERVQERGANVGEVFRHWAGARPDRRAYVFLADDETRRERTCAEMDAWARAIAARLQGRGLAGERALLVFEPGLDYVAALLGCLYAGVVAVPAYPPEPMRLARTFARLQRIVEDCRARVMLTTSEMAGRIHGLLPQVPRLDNVIPIDGVAAGEAAGWSSPTITPDDPAIIQYTSGSTGTPRGVVITHANLLANLRQMHRKLDHPDNVCVSWLPAYHDMGLISILALGFSCRPLVMMSPLAFFQRPVRWLRAISDFRASVSPAPNFGYDLCIRKVDPAECRGLDLSSWTRALNGSEPLRPETIERFCVRFAPHGMRREAFLPAYGMAEATLMITGRDPLSGAPVAAFDAAALRTGRAEPAGTAEPRTLVSCGRPVEGMSLLVVDPATCERLPENRVGEIWLSGPNVGAGYWGNPEETQRSFRARTRCGAGPFLRTGDMGFLRAGELFITGRLKELLIVCGRNHYPQDIERTVEQCHPELKAYGGAAFAVDDGRSERLVIVHEVSRPGRLDLPALLEEIRRRVGEEHQIPVDDVVLIRPGSLPKTSSGKTQRAACREQYLAGELHVVARLAATPEDAGGPAAAAPPPRTPTENLLAGIWSEVLGVADVGIDDDFFALGGNSLLAAQLIARIGQAVPGAVGYGDFFLRPSIAAVGRIIDERSGRGAGPGGGADVGLRPVAPLCEAGRRQPHDRPLSAAQQRLWFLDRLEPGSVAANVSAVIAIEGNLDRQVLERCFRMIIARHEVLRTSFRDAGGRPAPEPLGRGDWSLAYDDVRDLDPAGRRRELDRLAEAESGRPFDLGADWLVRARLVQLAEREFRLLLTMHHIVCDGWSMGVLRRELAAVYPAIAAGRPAPLPDLPLQYLDYAAWQRDWLEQGMLAGQLAYWRGRLADAPTALDLPLDRPRPAVRTYRGEAVRRRLDGRLLGGLAALARSRRRTLFMVLLAAWQALLHRLTGQDDIVVGTPIANRRLPEFEPLIGCFANTLALRVDLAGDPAFEELLDRVGATTVEALEHQDLPFERLVDELGLHRDASHSPLFQAMFVLQDAAGRGTGIAGLRVTEIELLHGGGAMFDLTLNVDQDEDGLRLLAVYNSDLMDAATVERMLESFQVLLEGIVADPTARLSDLPVLSPRARARLAEWHGPRPDPRPPASIVERVTDHARGRPDAAAVVLDDRTLSYRELDVESDRLARTLASLGIGPEAVVGVHLPRSPETIVAFLAAWKAGAAYLPLDPRLPEARLRNMIDDAAVAAVVTTSALAAGLPAALPTVCLDWPGAAAGSEPAAWPPCAADRLAYVLYTSGSSGRPKGVEIAHGGLASHAATMARMKGLVPGDRVLQFLSPSFDASAEEIYPTLVAGATLVLHPAPQATSGRELLEFSRRHGIGVLHVPSPLSLQLLDAIAAAGAERCGHLKLFVTGGDPLPPEKLRLWCDTLGGRARLLFIYGTTETTITTTVFEAPAAWRDTGPRVPIGRPISGRRAYVLDARLRPVPPGVVGELCIGGVGVGRGYRNRPQETTSRFLPDPLATERGGTMFRTGDLARFRADGQLEFLGRSDSQVKINGHRIEPGEIECLLAEHSAVREAAVVPRPGADGRAVLVAFCVPRDGRPFAPGELRTWLKGRCPDYMIPSRFVPLERLPQSAGGKIDRNALPVILPAQREATAAAQPRTPVERELAAIWTEVLRLEAVGIDDNFFEIGGDSIVSLQMVARAQAAGIAITARDVFVHQSISELAAAAAGRPATELESDEPTGPVPPTPIQRLVLALGPQDLDSFQQSVLLDLPAAWSPDTVRRGLQALLDRHHALRLRGRWHEGVWRQEIAAAGDVVDLDSLDASALSPAERERAIEQAAGRLRTSLALDRGPIWRCLLVSVPPGERPQLLVVVHHFAVDAVSWRIMLEDLELACAAVHAGAAVPPAPRTTSLRTWAERLVAAADLPEIRGEIGYWSAVAAADCGRIPCDLPGGANASGSARTVRRRLSAEDAGVLLNDIPAASHMRPHEILLCALGRVIARWSGHGCVRIDVETHGREPLFDGLDVGRTVGWFTGVFPALLRCELAADFGDVLRVNKQALRSVPRGGLGYGVLRWLGTDESVRNVLAAAAAEVGFNYLGRLAAPPPAAGSLGLRRMGIGPVQGPRQPRPHLLELLAWADDDGLALEMEFGTEFHRDATIGTLLDDVAATLRELIRDAARGESFVAAAADFPLAGIDDAELSALAAALKRASHPGEPGRGVELRSAR